MLLTPPPPVTPQTRTNALPPLLSFSLPSSQAECEQDLKAAEPIIAEAEAALNSLDKNSLGELKSFGSPAADVVSVVGAVVVLTSPGGKIPKDLSWAAGKKMMGNVDQFLKSLIAFDKDNTPENCCAQVGKGGGGKGRGNRMGWGKGQGHRDVQRGACLDRPHRQILTDR